REYLTRVFRRVAGLDAAARGATMTFAQKQIGGVHLTWGDEAHLEGQESGGGLESVYPSVRVLAGAHVAVVDRSVDSKGTPAAPEAYLQFLYTEPAQELIAKHYHRPTNRAVFERHKGTFPQLDLRRATTLVASGDWDDVQKRFFAEGGVFD